MAVSMGRFGPRSCAALFLAAAATTLAMPVNLRAENKGPQSVAPLAEKLIDAVVNISTSQMAKGPEGVPLPKVPKGSPFDEFFEDFFNKRGRSQQMDRKVSSLGSGFIVDGKEGLIVTNNHVIEGADEIIINFHDGTKLKVDKVVGRDSKVDLALLKVTPKKPLVEVPFGSSANMRVGDWVMAIGNPFGLGGSVTVGVISAKQRDINAGLYDDFIQTDAAINKGNSGGPLFNMEGQVVGINTAIISPTGGSIGIGFAVPSDTIVAIIQQLKEFGVARRGWLGVKIQSISEDIGESLGVSDGAGALVSGITPESPAAKGGLQAGDVILKFDGKDVTTMRGLPRLVAQSPIGKTVDVEILRQGETKMLRVEVGKLDEPEEKIEMTSEKPKEGPEPATQTVLGLTLVPLTDEIRAKAGLDSKIKGVLVMDIDPASPAAEKSIKAGDVIVEAQQEAVGSIEDLNKSIEKVKQAGGKSILLLVEDGKGDTRFVAVPLS